MTAQIPDRIRLDTVDHDLLNNPLETRTECRPMFVGFNTACWRRYIASWEVKDGLLYLVGIEGRVPDENDGDLSARERFRLITTGMGKTREATLEDIFPGRTGPIHASWYSGPLRIPIGELLHYSHCGYSSRYEEELILTVEEGRITRQELLSYRNSSHRRRLEELARRGVLTEYFERGIDVERLFGDQSTDSV